MGSRIPVNVEAGSIVAQVSGLALGTRLVQSTVTQPEEEMTQELQSSPRTEARHSGETSDKSKSYVTLFKGMGSVGEYDNIKAMQTRPVSGPATKS